ncbi:hypothetical protein FHR85_002063 [Alkalibacillus almallahensis]|nr:hypothetical protein [Alkalibacillus almallahensis]
MNKKSNYSSGNIVFLISLTGVLFEEEASLLVLFKNINHITKEVRKASLFCCYFWSILYINQSEKTAVI